MTPAQQKSEELIEIFKSEARADIYDEVFASLFPDDDMNAMM